MSKETSPELKLDIINIFGADLDQSHIRGNIVFISNKHCLIYPAAHHLVIKEISIEEKIKTQNNLNLLYLDNDLVNISCLNADQENNIFILCEEKKSHCSISLYYFSKITFDTVTVYSPKRKVMTNQYTSFTYASFTPDGNLLGAIAQEKGSNKTKGIIYEMNYHTPFVINKAKPISTFDLSNTVNKISFEKKLICTTGKFHIKFWYPYDSEMKEFNHNLNTTKDYIDHCWIIKKKPPTLLTITTENELYIIEGAFDRCNKAFSKGILQEDMYDKIDRFVVKQHMVNIFNSYDVQATVLQSYDLGIVIGNDKGGLVFIEKPIDDTHISHYESIRIIDRKREAKVTGLAFSDHDEYLAVAYSTNELAYINIQTTFPKLKNKAYEIPFNVICEGFHSGSITSIDMPLQRPIIMTVSNYDKTIRIWNYITGHCEYCKIVLLESDEYHLNNLHFLSIAIHPNGYYVAMSDKEMIWFFHLCYKELRYYGTDKVTSEPSKGNCTLVKFSNGGHLLAAVDKRHVHILKSYSREIIKSIVTNHVATIISVMFSANDDYIYTAGSDGFISLYNLFTFQGERLVSQSASYCDATYFLSDYLTTTILAIGSDGRTYSISELNFEKAQLDEARIVSSYHTPIQYSITAVVAIKSKKCNITGIALGTSDGRVIIEKYPYHDSQKKWDEAYAHFGKVNKLVYNRDTNLLFSTGEDGNIFIYCLYEYIDNNTIVFDNKIENFMELNSVLDEGLGDNALFPLDLLEKYEDDILVNKDIISQYILKDELKSKELKDALNLLEKEVTKRKDAEINVLKVKIVDMEEKQKEVIKSYEEKIEGIIEQNRMKMKEHLDLANEKLRLYQDELEKNKMESQLQKIKYELNTEKTASDYKTRFALLEKELKAQVGMIQQERDDLEANVLQQKKDEESKLKHYDGEHEFELKLYREKHKKELEDKDNLYDILKFEMIRLKDDKDQVEVDLAEKEKAYNTLLTKYETQSLQIQSLKDSLNNYEINKERLLDNITSLERKYQEKEKTEIFAHKLKNELYKKNVEVSSACNQQEKATREYKQTNKILVKSVTNTLSVIMNKDNENKRLYHLVDNITKECEKLRTKTNIIQENFNEILMKLYEAYHSTMQGKNPILVATDEIYHTYLKNDDVIKQIKNKKLNIDVREELENQIDALQRSIQLVNYGNDLTDKYFMNSKKKQIGENVSLLHNCSDLRVRIVDSVKDNRNLKELNNAFTKRIDNLEHRNAQKGYSQFLFPKLGKNTSMPNLLESNNTQLNTLQQIKNNYTKSSNSNNFSGNISIESYMTKKNNAKNNNQEHFMSIRHLSKET